MVVTIIEAVVDPSREDDLVATYERAGGETLPPFIHKTFLLKGQGGVWRIVTVWRSREDLERYRRGGERVVIFGAVDAEPDVKDFDVVVHRGPHSSGGG